MKVSSILQELPASLEWMVMFEHDAISSIADTDRIREMFFLSPEIDLQGFSHTVLTSAGRCLAPREQGPLINGETGEPMGFDCAGATLADRFSEQTRLFPVDDAHSFALGHLEGYPPVLLHIEIDGKVARARTLFAEKPTRKHFELLQSVGVRYVATEPRPDGCIVHFENRLPDHIQAGVLARFSRTTECNLFFLQHGDIDPKLEAGLLDSSNNRIGWKYGQVMKAVEHVARRALQSTLAMRWIPPTSQEPTDFGDVVPLGFVNAALKSGRGSEVQADVERRLYENQLRGLWPFQSNDLETSTDSVLVMQGLSDKEAVERLDRFSDGHGGFLPQLTAPRAESGKMLFEDEKRHWCQADYATTCFVAGARRKVGLDIPADTVRYIREGFETRGGLYFANPYLVDWAVAQAIADGEEFADLRAQLIREISTSMNEDYTFGTYDRPLSTAFAILALGTLGCRGRILRAAQLALSRAVDDEGMIPVTTPFYSSLLLNAGEEGGSIVKVLNRLVGISHHSDTHRMVGLSVTAMALDVPRLEDEPDRDTFVALERAPHARYRCADVVSYVRDFALPRYLEGFIHKLTKA